jgi:hypothetical protein
VQQRQTKTQESMWRQWRTYWARSPVLMEWTSERVGQRKRTRQYNKQPKQPTEPCTCSNEQEVNKNISWENQEALQNPMEAQTKQGQKTRYQPKLFILSDPVFVPSMHEVQQKNNLNKKEQSRSELGYRFWKDIITKVSITNLYDDQSQTTLLHSSI